MPRVFDQHTLSKYWGFKHDSERAPRGIKVHADEAAVNVNFWVVPDDANQNATSGGIVVYNHKVGPGTDLATYNNNEVDVEQLGITEKDIKRRVPYRQNRAVLFTSVLFHATDTVQFVPGFKTCRINYTLLFGFMESMKCSVNGGSV